MCKEKNSAFSVQFFLSLPELTYRHTLAQNLSGKSCLCRRQRKKKHREKATRTVAKWLRKFGLNETWETKRIMALRFVFSSSECCTWWTSQFSQNCHNHRPTINLYSLVVRSDFLRIYFPLRKKKKEKEVEDWVRRKGERGIVPSRRHIFFLPCFGLRVMMGWKIRYGLGPHKSHYLLFQFLSIDGWIQC